ncbi:MAG: HNH endonuclease [Nitrosopumilaceae archaeon]|nr:HNH endonuclease [Nitrosopumilaceae archaeon]
MYRHATPSLAASGGRPVEHIVWTWPEGVSLYTALQNLHDGRCWCGGRPMTGGLRPYQDAWACSRRHRYTWWDQFEFWPGVRFQVLQRDKYRCVQCGAGPGPDGEYVPRDMHVLCVVRRTPVGNGGAPWDRSNLQTLCRACHGVKARAARRKLSGQGRRELLQLRQLEEFA